MSQENVSFENEAQELLNAFQRVSDVDMNEAEIRSALPELVEYWVSLLGRLEAAGRHSEDYIQIYVQEFAERSSKDTHGFVLLLTDILSNTIMSKVEAQDRSRFVCYQIVFSLIQSLSDARSPLLARLVLECQGLLPGLCQELDDSDLQDAGRAAALLSALLYHPGVLEGVTEDLFGMNMTTQVVEAIHEHAEHEHFVPSMMRVVLAINEYYLLRRSPNNPVLQCLSQRLHTASSFGQSLIFMLNETKHDDLTNKLYILKLIYLILEHPLLREYFYDNDLRVLVDIFIRELNDLPDMNKVCLPKNLVTELLFELQNLRQTRLERYKLNDIRRCLKMWIDNGNRTLASSLKTGEQLPFHEVIQTGVHLAQLSLQQMKDI